MEEDGAGLRVRPTRLAPLTKAVARDFFAAATSAPSSRFDRQLHKLTYAVALLGGLHFVLLVKGFQIEPLLYLGAVCLLLALRLPGVARLRLA